MFSTEGDTDPENYRAIVWGGKQAEEIPGNPGEGSPGPSCA